MNDKSHVNQGDAGILGNPLNGFNKKITDCKTVAKSLP